MRSLIPKLIYPWSTSECHLPCIKRFQLLITAPIRTPLYLVESRPIQTVELEFTLKAHLSKGSQIEFRGGQTAAAIFSPRLNFFAIQRPNIFGSNQALQEHLQLQPCSPRTEVMLAVLALYPNYHHTSFQWVFHCQFGIRMPNRKPTHLLRKLRFPFMEHILCRGWKISMPWYAA